MYYSKSKHTLIGFKKAKDKKKKYDAILERNDGRIFTVPFGAIGYENYHDLTGLALYKSHGDLKRKKNYRARHKHSLKAGYYSPGYFSYNYLW